MAADSVEALVLAPAASGACGLEVQPYARAVACVEDEFATETRSLCLEEVPGLRALVTRAGPQYFPLNPLGSCVAMALGAPPLSQWSGPVAFYRADSDGLPLPLTAKDAVLVTSLTIRAMHELTGQNI